MSSAPIKLSFLLMLMYEDVLDLIDTDDMLVILETLEAARDEVATLAVAPRGRYPAEDRLRDLLARFDFDEPSRRPT